MARRSLALAFLFLSFLAGASSAQAPLPAVADAGLQPLVDPARVVSRNVIVISIDGLRADAIETSGAPTLGRLFREGSSTIEAQTILPSKTLPSHASMLTGVVPETHGITWNSDMTGEFGVVSVPTVFELAHQAGYSTAAFFSKKKFNHLIREGSLDEVQVPRWGVLPASRTVTEAVRYMRREKPNLLFVHIAEADFMGHQLGWGSRMYNWAVREADAAVEELIENAERTYGRGNYTLILTSDHGGHGKDHGTDHIEDTTIPWITYGQGIRPAHRIQAAVRTMDTAATVLRVLGMTTPADWDGAAVSEVLAVTVVENAPAAPRVP